jgi:cytochrome c
LSNQEKQREGLMVVSRLIFAALILLAGYGAACAQSLNDRLAAGDPAKGAKIFNQCRACHTIEEGGPTRVGPNLWGVIGRPVASVEGYAYSDAMRAFGGVWTVDRLDVYLTAPRKMVPGINMTFSGLPKPEQRADVIMFLNQNSPSPLSFTPDGGTQ